MQPAGPDHNASSPLLSSAVSPLLWDGQTEWEGPVGRVDNPFHSLIQAEAGDGFLMPSSSVLRRARVREGISYKPMRYPICQWGQKER